MTARPRVELTRRGWALSGAAVGMLVASRLLGALELAILGLSALALLGTAMVWVRLRRGQLDVERTVRPGRTHVGAEARVDLEILARPGRRARGTPQTTLTDEFDGGRRAARFLVPALPAGQRARAAYRVPTGRRGRFAIGPAVLAVADPFGLARIEWDDRAEDEITVCPRVHELRAPRGAPGFQRTVSPFTATFHAPAPDGEEFLSLREYAVGDDLRRIHWRATARTGDLVVREDETQWRPRTLVVIDTREGTHTDESFEAAVEATASIVAQLARTGHPFEVTTLAGRLLGEATAGRRHGVGVEARIMDELAVVQLEPDERTAPHALARLRPGGRRRGLLVAVVGDVATPELDALAGSARTDAPVVLVRTRPGAAVAPAPNVAVVDGREGRFVASWDATMLGAHRARDPGVSRWRAGALAPVALAGVTAAAALGLARVFADGSFAGPVLVAAVLPHALGAAGRRVRAHPVVIVAATAVALLLWCAWVFAPASTAYGIPTPATLARLADRLDAGWQVFRTGVAPVEPTRGVVLLCAAIVTTVGTVADLLAFRSRATIGALVPSLLLFVLAATLGTDDLLIVTTLAYVVAALVFLLLANQARLESRRAWATGRRLRSDASVVNAGLAVGAVAVVAGLVLAPALPGADDGPLLDYKSIGGRSGRGAGDYRTLSPLVDIRARLLDQGDVELFRVRSPLRLAWRVAALDRFDGRIWGIESTARDAARVLDREPAADEVEQEYSISSLDAQWLPAAYRPRSVNVDGARIIPESSTLIAPRPSIAGLRYRVRSEVPPVTPTPAQVAATDQRDFTFDRYTELPDDFPASVERQARSIVRGAANPYDAAKRLEQFFLDGSFTYDLRVEGGSGADAIVEFLSRRRGFCEQFAGTFAAMARAVGLPARVAVGFTAGTYDADDDRYVVSSRNAHAWPEVWLAGLGWTAFEPTPAGPEPGQADAAQGSPTAPADEETSPSTTATTTPSAPATPPSGAAPQAGASEVSAGAPAGTGGSGIGRGRIVLAVLALATIGAIALAARRIGWKRRRRTARRTASDPAHSVAGAWQDALEQLAGAGLAPSESLTPREQSRAYRERGVPEPAADALERLAGTYSAAGWSGQATTVDDVVTAWEAADAVRDALAAEAGAVERARRSLRAPELTSR